MGSTYDGEALGDEVGQVGYQPVDSCVDLFGLQMLAVRNDSNSNEGNTSELANASQQFFVFFGHYCDSFETRRIIARFLAHIT